jgi:hypothetical protein
MNKARIIAGVLTVCLSLPIWFYLFYKILETVNASELMWFLYWIYVPTALLASILSRIAEGEQK